MFLPTYDDFAPFKGDFEDSGYGSDVEDHYYGIDELEPSSSQESNPADCETDEGDDRDQPPALDPKPPPRAITPAELAQALPDYYSTSSDEEEGASSPSPDSSPARLATTSSTPSGSDTASPSESFVVTPTPQPEEYFDPDYFIHNRPDPIFEPDPSSQSTVHPLDSNSDSDSDSDSDLDSDSDSDSGDEEVNAQPLSLTRPAGSLPKIRIPPLSSVANGPPTQSRPSLPKIRIPPLAARNLLQNIPTGSSFAQVAGKEEQSGTGKNLKRRRDSDADSNSENRPPLRRSKRVKR